MTRIPKRVSQRLAKVLPRYQKVLAEARDRDVNEADTVTIIKDVLSDVFGFDKYSELTSEQAIRGTYCDLAAMVDGSIQFLVEVKAIGLDLKDSHLRQAVNYGANHGISWVVLTNGARWEIYRIKFEKPISHELVCGFDMTELNPRSAEDQGRLFMLCREGVTRDAIDEFHRRNQTINKFVLAALIQSEGVLRVLRRELRKVPPGSMVSVEEVQELLLEVLKRDVTTGDAATAARRKVARVGRAKAKVKEASQSEEAAGAEA